MTNIKNENYIVIQGFMINELKLKGNELLIYAIIYGFSQDEEQTYSGSLQYLANWTNSTKQGVIKNLKSLIEKGLLQKKEKYINGVKFVEYYATKFNGGIKQSLMGVLNIVYQGSKQSLPNNIDNNIIYKLDNNIKKENIIKEKKFIKPTIEEIQEYCNERKNNIDAEHFYNFYESKGWKVGNQPMKNWKASVITWEKKNKSSNNEKLTNSQKQNKVLEGIYNGTIKIN